MRLTGGYSCLLRDIVITALLITLVLLRLSLTNPCSAVTGHPRTTATIMKTQIYYFSIITIATILVRFKSGLLIAIRAVLYVW